MECLCEYISIQRYRGLNIDGVVGGVFVRLHFLIIHTYSQRSRSVHLSWPGQHRTDEIGHKHCPRLSLEPEKPVSEGAVVSGYKTSSPTRPFVDFCRCLVKLWRRFSGTREAGVSASLESLPWRSLINKDVTICTCNAPAVWAVSASSV